MLLPIFGVSWVVVVMAAPIKAPVSPPTSETVPITPNAQALTSILPATQETQSEVFAYLKMKSGREVTLPRFPSNNLIAWTQQKFEVAGRDSQLLYPAVYEQLLIAQQLLADKNPQQRRRGLRVAHNINFKVATRLRDKWLSSRLFDAFILPYLDALSAGGQGQGTLNRQRLLQDAGSAYRLTGEKSKHLAILRFLVKAAEDAKNTDGADWARIKLAESLVAQGNFQEAIANLKAVESPNMSGSKRWIPELEEKQRQLEALKSKSQN
jgi:hypothetical protein